MDSTSIIFKVKGQEVWSVKITTPEEDRLYAGVYFAYILIVNNFPQFKDAGFMIVRHGKILRHLEFLDTMDIKNVRTNYHKVNGASITLYFDAIENHPYGWWMKQSHHSDDLQITTFNSIEFVQGFIAGCNSWGVDFRTLIIGLPFKHLNDDKGTIEYFDIQGYDIPQPAFMPTSARRKELETQD